MSAEGSATPSIVPCLPGAPEQTYLFPKAKGHSRSISHGGTPILIGNIAPTSASRPVPLKSALRGHQRAFSHGQIGDNSRATSGTGGAGAAPGPSHGHSHGHSRTGSRTDFILPPGHRDPPPASALPRHSSVRQHSRQASRSDSIYTLRRDSEVGPLRKAFFWVLRRQPPIIDNCNLIVIPNHLVPEKTPAKDHPNGKRCNNKIRTTKYTLLSFIPKNLFEQFHRIANLYFIFIVLLNWVPTLNAFGKEVAMFPVLFVLGVTAIKDLYEDRRRHLSDKRINNLFCRVYKRSLDRYVTMKWKDVKVGDMVHLSNNESVPADMVILNTATKSGVCYLDTCNLDGETNLKIRSVVSDFKGINFKPSKFRSTVEVERPSTKIYRFTGMMSHPDGVRIPLTSNNLLLRECTIKNTDYVDGIVVYAGHETKAMLNNGGPRYKCSRLERRMNTDVIWCVLVLLVLCCIGAIGCKIWLDQYNFHDLPYFLPIQNSSSYEGLLIFWTYIIILQVMIPVSLYVTIEMTKLLQLYHIQQDVQMYDPSTNTRIQCRALNITEELGQVSYLFSDKTGTLTENKMVFRRCTVGGIDYKHPNGPPAEPSTLPPLVTPLNYISPNPRMLQHLMGADDVQQTLKVREFLTILATCNTVMVSLPHVDTVDVRTSVNSVTKENHLDDSSIGSMRTTDKYSRLTESRSTTPSPPPSTSPLRLILPKLPFGKKEVEEPITPAPKPVAPHYEAESPDELALVETALAYGYELRKRSIDELEMGVRGEIVKMRVLRIQEFDSTRKCMSIALRIDPQQVVIYVKGADSSVLSALAPIRAGSPESAVYERTLELLSEYSHAGLRTLVLAKRTMTPALWESWLAGHHRACEPTEGREKRIRESLARLESALTLIGATGVEDSLQEAVPETIRSLLDAGIVVWVLTGDKPETAINIAYSASLFSQEDQLLQLMVRGKEQAENAIQGYLESLVSDETSGAVSRGRALVVDGRTLTYILDRRSGLVGPFLALARKCSSVLCCRATPLQKAYIVKAVKDELKVTTLAVGDGANDVSMIQTADVGIGLSGQEGRQAVMASDFALSRFKYLQRLLLVHGHWSYDRLARMIMYFFVKNATFVFLVFWFQLYNGFSSSVMIEQVHLMAYNLMFTALPPFVMGAYDRVAPASLLQSNPGFYNTSRRGLTYRSYSFWLILIESIYMSLVIFFSCLCVYWDSHIDLSRFGVVNMTCCLVIMLVFVAVETRSWTLIHVVALVGSLALYFVATLIYQSISIPFLGLMPHKSMSETLADPFFWLLVVYTMVVAVVPRLTWRALCNTVCPTGLNRSVLSRRRAPRPRLPYAAHYHTTTASAHVYRATSDEDHLQKSNSDVTAIT